MAMYYNGKKVRNLYYNGKCITRLALGKEMTRLVEGDDFERKEWLKTTGYAYINTKVKGTQNSEFTVTAIQRNNPTAYAITLYGSVPDDVNSAISFNVSTTQMARNTRFGNRAVLLANYALNEEYTVFQSKDVLSVNGIVVSNTEATNNFESGEMYLFSSNISDDITPYLNRELWIKKFAIDNSIDLIPCRLLRPIPAALDANGIARNADECGMYDSVSGKFYGNVAASGAFTVEPSLVEGVDYERHKWLKGDGSAYIDTLVSDLTNVKQIYCKIKPSYTANIWKTRIFGRENVAQFSDSRFVVYNSGTAYITVYTGTIYSDLNFSADSGWVRINAETNTASTSQPSSVTIENINKNGVSLGLFADHGSTFSAIYEGSIGEFTIDESMQLIPVRLLRPLPSYLDANGKARHQFECGMLDLKTMKFYGNVNTSGNFSVSDN